MNHFNSSLLRKYCIKIIFPFLYQDCCERTSLQASQNSLICEKEHSDENYQRDGTNEQSKPSEMSGDMMTKYSNGKLHSQS